MQENAQGIVGLQGELDNAFSYKMHTVYILSHLE